MDKIKEIFALIFGSSLLIEGKDRTFAKLPMWLAIVAGLSSLALLFVTALLVVALGMTVKTVKA